MSESTDAEIRSKTRELLAQVDIETMGIKKFIKLLSDEMGHDLKSKKDFIKEALTEAIQDMHESAEASDDSDDDEDTPASGPVKKSKGGGLAVKKEISPELAALLGKGNTMARTDIVKSLWEYIREHDLQNPSNKREIILDAPLKDVFGCDTFTMFTLNKYIGAHIHPFKPVDLTTNSSSTPAKSPSSKSRGVKRKATPSTEKKKRKAGAQPPFRLSDELAAVVGKSILPRPQVVKGIWAYIKANNLQNPNDGREIICDDLLKAVMKKEKVTMFNMNQFITPHLLEKVDKGLYQIEEEEVDGSDSE
jgi:upstream activation factor subunit UAF30